MGRRRRTAKRKTTTRKAKEEKVEEMASYGIFLRLAFLCFFIVRFADSATTTGLGLMTRGMTMDTTPTTGATIHTTGATIHHHHHQAMDTRSTKLWIQQRIQRL